MTDNDRATCAALAGFLRAGALLAHWGFMLTCISVLVLGLTQGSPSTIAIMGFGGVVFLGAMERYFAVRLRFDAALFDSMALNTVASLDALDEAFVVLGLRQQRPQVPTRTLADRAHGTRQLMSRHLFVVAGQSAVFLFTVIIQRSH